MRALVNGAPREFHARRGDGSAASELRRYVKYCLGDPVLCDRFVTAPSLLVSSHAGVWLGCWVAPMLGLLLKVITVPNQWAGKRWAGMQQPPRVRGATAGIDGGMEGELHVSASAHAIHPTSAFCKQFEATLQFKHPNQARLLLASGATAGSKRQSRSFAPAHHRTSAFGLFGRVTAVTVPPPSKSG